MEKYNINHRGQALVEVLIGLSIAAILIGAATAAVVMILRSNLETKSFQTASSLAQELIDNVKIIAEADWHDIYGLATSTQYYVSASGTTLIVLPGTATTTIGNITFVKFFLRENVKRLGDLISEDPSAIDDPSTLKITSRVQWTSGGRTSEVPLTIYLTRWRNLISRQTDWSQGYGQEGPITEFNRQFSTSTNIDYSGRPGSIYLTGFTVTGTNIDYLKKYAWSDIGGWLDMRATDYEEGVVVSSEELTKYAYGTNYGLVSFNCSNTNGCGYNYKVSNSNGTLSGYAWSENFGWISFNCSDMATYLGNPNYCTTVSNYKVTIDSSGDFHGWAWSDNAGWTVFNCKTLADLPEFPDNFCTSTSDFYVKTSWTP